MTSTYEPRTAYSHHSPNKPRVAVISYHTSPLAEMGGPETGGMNIYVRELCQALGARGFMLDVFTRRSSEVAPEIQPFGPNVRVVDIDAGPPSRIAKARLPAFIADFERGVRAFAEREGLRYDIVASHYWMSGRAGVSLAQAWHAPHVVMFHTLAEAKNRARNEENETAERIEAERAIVAAADAIIVASQHETELLAEVYGADVAKVSEVPCGLDLELFSPIEKDLARETLHLPGDERIVLFVGRIEPLKGIDVLIGAAAVLHDGRKFRVLIVGGDGSTIEQINELRAQAKRLGVDHHISFVGAVDHSQLPTYYSAADICVVPSYYESFGLVAVESMACGTPVVATHVGGLATTIIDGETGYLVSQRLAAPFAERIGRLMLDADLRTAFGLAGQEAVERYRWANVADAVGELYRSLLMKEAS